MLIELLVVYGRDM